MIKTKIENQHVHFNVTKIGMFSLRYHIVCLSIKSNYTKSIQNTFKEKTSCLPIYKVFFFYSMKYIKNMVTLWMNKLRNQRWEQRTQKETKRASGYTKIQTLLLHFFWLILSSLMSSSRNHSQALPLFKT